MVTPFEQGRADGQWTEEQLKRSCYRSAQECLECHEAMYQQEKAHLAEMYAQNPVGAAQHEQYLEGWITGARESLRRREGDESKDV